MTSTSLRNFSRDPKLRKKVAQNGEKILIESREKNGSSITFLVIPLPKTTLEKEGKKIRGELKDFIGAWKTKKKTTIASDKKLIRKLWANVD